MFQIFHLEKELAELREVKSACWPHRLWGENSGSDVSAMPVCVGLFVTVKDCSVGDCGTYLVVLMVEGCRLSLPVHLTLQLCMSTQNSCC